MEAVQTGRGEETASDAFDDRHPRCDVCRLRVNVLVQLLPPGQVQVGVRLDVHHLPGAQHPRPAEVVQQGIGRDAPGIGVVEADVGGHVHSLNRLQQVDDDDRDAGLVGFLDGWLDHFHLDGRNGDDVHLSLHVVLQDRHLIGEGHVGSWRLGDDFHLDAVRPGVLSRFLEEVGGRLEHPGDVRRRPAYNDLLRARALLGHDPGLRRDQYRFLG